MSNCRFYGCHAVPKLQLLVDSMGNQCALITDAYSPCVMEVAGQAVNWEKCPRNYHAGSVPFEHFTKPDLDPDPGPQN